MRATEHGHRIHRELDVRRFVEALPDDSIFSRGRHTSGLPRSRHLLPVHELELGRHHRHGCDDRRRSSDQLHHRQANQPTPGNNNFYIIISSSHEVFQIH